MSRELSDQLEKQFLDLARESWKIHQMFFWDNCIDEVIIGYVTKTSIDKGYTLLDIINGPDKSSFVNSGAADLVRSMNCHYLVFENNNNKSRLIYKLERIAKDVFETKSFGHLSKITIGYGEKSDNVAKIQTAINMEYDENIAVSVDPGAITLLPDEKSCYLYAQVSMILDISKYSKDNQPGEIDLNKIDYDIASILYSLKKYLDGIK